MRTCVFVTIGLAGLLMNVLVGHLVPASLAENILGLLVVLSVALIAMGFVPGHRKWPGARMATVVMGIAFAVYMAYLAVTVVRYALNEDESNPQSARAQVQ